MPESTPELRVLTPERVGDYEVLLPIGSGGMATVYLATKSVVRGVSREFALKLMHAHLRGDPNWATHLLDEARIVARIRHPNVVQLVEAGDDPLGVFLVLEYVEGDTLSGLIRSLRARQERLPFAVSGRILLDALSGLHASHELLGLVHRDFSPQNILVGVDGIAKLTDFGIAKASDGQLTASGVVKGKFSYMAPEQARGKPVDRRADVWAAGVVAWELLAGRRLYPSRNDADTLLAVVSERPPPLASIAQDIPAELSRVVEWALEPDLDKRCPDARTLSEHLRAPWAQALGLSEPAELGDFVGRTSAEMLAKRRADVERVLERRGQASAIRELPDRSRSAPAHVPEPTPIAADPTGAEPTTALELVSSAPQRSRRAALVGVGGALALAAAAALAMVSRRSEPEAPIPAASPAHVPDSVVSPPPQPPKLATLELSANADIRRVRIGRRVVEIERPARKVELQLTTDEASRALHVEATSTTGASATAEVGPDDGSASVRFPSPQPERRVVRPKARPKSAAGDELAPTPFK